jgi:hypothetical protein
VNLKKSAAPKCLSDDEKITKEKSLARSIRRTTVPMRENAQMLREALRNDMSLINSQADRLSFIVHCSGRTLMVKYDAFLTDAQFQAISEVCDHFVSHAGPSSDGPADLQYIDYWLLPVVDPADQIYRTLVAGKMWIDPGDGRLCYEAVLPIKPHPKAKRVLFDASRYSLEDKT